MTDTNKKETKVTCLDVNCPERTGGKCDKEEKMKTELFDWKEIEKECGQQFGYYGIVMDFIKAHCVPKKDYEKEIKEWKEYLEQSIKDTKYFEDKLKEAEKKLEAVRKWSAFWEVEVLFNSEDGVDFDELNKILKD